MDLSAFLNVMFGFRKNYDGGRKPGRAEFIRILTDALIPDENEKTGKTQVNPMYQYGTRMLQEIFNGKKSVKQEYAAQLRLVMDQEQFETYFDDFSHDALVSLALKLGEYGFDATPDNVDKVCASIFIQLIEHIADGKPEVVSKVDFKAREAGRRLKDIPPASVEYRDGRIHIGGETLTVNMKEFSEEEADDALQYVKALYEAYASALGRESVSSKDVDTLPERFKRNLAQQKRAFYYADAIQHSVRDQFDDGEDEFNKLVDDEKTFIDNTYWKKYDNGFDRLVAVLDRAMEANLSASVLANIRNLINNLAKMGICQILVNEGEITSWVIEDE